MVEVGAAPPHLPTPATPTPQCTPSTPSPPSLRAHSTCTAHRRAYSPWAPLPPQELLVSPALLAAHNIPVVKVVHNPGEWVVVYPGAYHSGFNHGFNIAGGWGVRVGGWWSTPGVGGVGGWVGCLPRGIPLRLQPPAPISRVGGVGVFLMGRVNQHNSWGWSVFRGVVEGSGWVRCGVCFMCRVAAVCHNRRCWVHPRLEPCCAPTSPCPATSGAAAAVAPSAAAAAGAARCCRSTHSPPHKP